MPNEMNIYIVGPLAVGKTTIGRKLAERLSLAFHDSDQLVQQRTGATVAWIFDVEGEAGFRRRERAAIHDITAQQGIVLATGGGSILTAENRQRLSATGTVVFLYTDLEILLSRARLDEKRPLLHADDVGRRIEELWEQRLPFYREVADFTLKTTDKSVTQICEEIERFCQQQNALL